MLDIKRIRQNPEHLDDGLRRRGKDPVSHTLLTLDEQLRQSLTDLQSHQTKRHEIAKRFADAKKNQQDTAPLSQEGETLKAHIAQGEEEVRQRQKALKDLLAQLPNLPHLDVPEGKDESDNREIRRVGLPRVFSFVPRPHWELGEGLAQMSFDRATQMAGARFVVLFQDLARLERALAAFMLDIHTQEFGYHEVSPPLLVNDQALFGTGLLPKFQEDLFQTTAGYWLIPTSEVALTSLVMDQVLSETQLPLRYTAYTPCFRSEAGAAGRDTRGMIRQHQFSKVELVSIVHPEESEREHERMTAAAEEVLKRLDLPYRVMLLCAGDMGFQSQKTYDLEVWLPSQETYREISSCSQCGDFQARRMNARYRTEQGIHFVHTLNGSGLAVGRTLVALLENYQNEDGSIGIPQALRPYLGGVDVLCANRIG